MEKSRPKPCQQISPLHALNVKQDVLLATGNVLAYLFCKTALKKKKRENQNS